MVLNEEEKQWIERAISSKLTPLQMKKKLKDNNYSREKIDEFAEYFHAQISIDKEPEKNNEEIEKQKEEEKQFEKDVKTYQTNPEKLGYFKKKEIKKWLKNIKKYIIALDEIIKGIRLEIKKIEEKFGRKNKKVNEELNDLKDELIDRIIDAKDILIIEHPYEEGLEVTKENLKEVQMDDLIKLIEDGKNELELIVNGKI